MPYHDHPFCTDPFEVNAQRLSNAVFHIAFEVLFHQDVLAFVFKGSATLAIVAQRPRFVLSVFVLTKGFFPAKSPPPPSTAGQ